MFVRKKKLQGNITKFMLFKTIRYIKFWAAILIVYFSSVGMSNFQITSLDVIWAVMTFLTEIPSGVLSDKWKRKYVLAIASFFDVIYMIGLALGHNYWFFVFIVLFNALSDSFYSGTETSILYDTLKELGQTSKFKKIMGKVRLYSLVIVSLAGMIGSYLAVYVGFRVLFLLSAGASLISALVALSFTEPDIKEPSEDTTMLIHVKEALKYILNKRDLLMLIAYFVLVDLGMSYLMEYDQLYLKAIAFPLGLFGVFAAIRTMASGMGAYCTEFLDKFTFSSVTNSVLFILIVGLLTIALAPWKIALGVFILLSFIWGAMEMQLKQKVHDEFLSRIRATSESLIVFLSVILDVPLRLLFGFISDKYNINFGYAYYAFVLVIFTIIYFIYKTQETKNLQN